MTNLADRKSRQMIRKAHRANPDAVIVVSKDVCPKSCIHEAAKIPGVKLVLLTQYRNEIVDLIEMVQKTGRPMIKVKDIMDSKDFEDTPISSYQEGQELYLKYRKAAISFVPIV